MWQKEAKVSHCTLAIFILLGRIWKTHSLSHAHTHTHAHCQRTPPSLSLSHTHKRCLTLFRYSSILVASQNLRVVVVLLDWPLFCSLGRFFLFWETCALLQSCSTFSISMEMPDHTRVSPCCWWRWCCNNIYQSKRTSNENTLKKSFIWLWWFILWLVLKLNRNERYVA